MTMDTRTEKRRITTNEVFKNVNLYELDGEYLAILGDDGLYSIWWECADSGIVLEGHDYGQEFYVIHYFLKLFFPEKCSTKDDDNYKFLEGKGSELYVTSFNNYKAIYFTINPIINPDELKPFKKEQTT